MVAAKCGCGDLARWDALPSADSASLHTSRVQIEQRLAQNMSRRVVVGKEGSVAPGRSKKVYVRDRRIAVFNDGGTLRAVDDGCTHSGGSLSAGLCEDGVVTCPWHGARFRLCDGMGLGPPAYRRLQTYSVSVEHGIITVEVDD